MAWITYSLEALIRLMPIARIHTDLQVDGTLTLDQARAALLLNQVNPQMWLLAQLNLKQYGYAVSHAKAPI